MISVEDFCRVYQKNSVKALTLLSDLNNEDTAAFLIDAGGIIFEKSLLNDGIDRLEKLQISEPESSYRSYCIANGRHLRASINLHVSSPMDNDVLDDLFWARIEHSKVLSGKCVSLELPSQSATNIGNVFLETGRWIEALDFFQKARSVWPKNGVSAFREMQCLMGFYNAARNDYGKFGTYSDLDQLYQHIVELSKVVKNTYTEIGQLAGEKAVIQAKHAVSQIKTQGVGDKPQRANPFFNFVENNALALSLFCSPKQYKTGKIDTLTFQRVSGDWSSSSVPEIFAMLNVMKADYALARQLFYESKFDDCATIFHETGRFGDTLDYSIYGVQVSAMCSAQKIAYDILNKIAVALSDHFKIKNAKSATFDSFWYKYEDQKRVGLVEAVQLQLKGGNRGLLALYDLHRDTTKEASGRAGFLRAIKEYRNASTHRFTVLHDENIGIDRASGKLVDHEHVTRFQDLTLSSIRLARASLFYFCDAISFAEERKPKSPNAISLTHTVLDHDYMRGHDFEE
jgi:tetratricopeptide (TPR) repeat protein